MTISQWCLLIIGLLMSAMGGFFLKLGAIQIQYDGNIFEIFKQVVLNWKIGAGVLMYLVPVLVWIFLLKKIELSFLQPLFSIVYVITPILASVFLNESVATARWFGIGVIIIGVVIVARS